jgi:hypothetical protein
MNDQQLENLGYGCSRSGERFGGLKKGVKLEVKEKRTQPKKERIRTRE